MTGFALLPLLLTGSAVLFVSGVSKLRRPAHAVAALAELRLPAPSLLVRAGSACELLAACTCVARPRAGAAAATVLYCGFALLVALQLRRGSDRSCGCLGSADTPPTRLHLAANVAFAAAAAAYAAAGPASLGTIASHPLAVGVITVAVAAGAWSLVAGLPLVPDALGAYRRPAP